MKASLKKIWYHQPLTDIWQIGKGIANRLHISMALMIAWYYHDSRGKLYRSLVLMQELIIDHAWGREPCTIAGYPCVSSY